MKPVGIIANQAPKVRYMFGGQVEKLPLVIRTTPGGWIRAAGQPVCHRGWHDGKGLCVAQFGPECNQVVVANAAITVSVGQ